MLVTVTSTGMTMEVRGLGAAQGRIVSVRLWRISRQG